MKGSFISPDGREDPNKVLGLLNIFGLVLPDDDILDSIAQHFEVAYRMTNIFVELTFAHI